MNFYGRPDPEDLTPVNGSEQPIGPLEFIEMSSEEIQKFKKLGPITQAEIDNTDLDQLAQDLQK